MYRSRILNFALVAFSLSTLSASAGIRDCANPTTVSVYGTPMVFCDIPAGSADIGSRDGAADEKPVLRRHFLKFQIAQYTVTQKQYVAMMGTAPWTRPSEFSPYYSLKPYVKEGDQYPATYVSHTQAVRFAAFMTQMDPTAIYRLPTEAEFEYAARAGTTTKYYWGDSIEPYDAYYSENSSADHQHPKPVNSCPSPLFDSRNPGYCANGFGLMHMLGNVWQWTADTYRNNYTGAPMHGNIPVIGDPRSPRVMRGGYWANFAPSLRSASRLANSPDLESHFIGFRLVRIPR